MNKLRPAVCALCLIIPWGLSAAIPYQTPNKSISASGQFVIYCNDLALRLAVSSFCEETKSGIQGFLSLKDEWKIPIVINLYQPDATLPDLPLSQVLVSNVEGGSRKIELNVTLRGNLTDIHFQQLVVRTILLEMEYRARPAWKDGDPIIDPPQWLVEGFSAYLRNRDTEVDTDVYKTLLANSSMPTLEDFLSQTTDGMNASSLKLYQAYAFSFLQLLVGLQDGQKALCSYIYDLPLGHDAPSEDLIKHFPALGGSSESLEKWWTLSMARLAAADRYKGLSLDETEQRLIALLKLNIPVDKNGKTKEYPIEDFKEFVKNPQARPALAMLGISMQLFAAEANALYRPIIAEYMLIIEELQTGKAGRVEPQLKEVAQYREMVLKRMDQIADYMNWYEATQISSRSDSFDDYLSTAKQQLQEETPKRNDAISRYLDSLEIQMQ